jgi:6-phosphogluconolactonase
MNKILLIFFVPLFVFSCKTEVKKEETSLNSENKNDIPLKSLFPFYVGTYTRGESEGIYKYNLLSNGQIESIGLLSRTENPSFLAISPDDEYLLAVNETSGGSIESYAIEGDSLKLISERNSGGGSPCYISVNDQGFVLVANYNGGNVGLFHLNSDGYLSSPLDFQQHEGQGATPRQEKPHAHFSEFFPNSQNVISVDLGTNEIWFSILDIKAQKFEALNTHTLSMDPGAGPRHLVIHPTANYLYVLNELNYSVTVVKKVSDSYEVGKSYTAIPNNSCDNCSGAEIQISSDGNFLYASIRGHNSIAIFRVEKGGEELTLISNTNTRGETPRHFALSPDEKFLVVANQNSNNLVSFSRDEETGKLVFLASVDALSPVCILFE